MISTDIQSPQKASKRSLAIYLAVTFAAAWVLMILASTVGQMFFQPLVALSMFAPMLGLLAAKGGIGLRKAGVSWRIRLLKNWKYIIIAWLLPTIVTALGAFIYFALFRGEFDPNCGYLAAAYAPYLDASGTVQGISLRLFVLILTVQAVTYAPLINMFLAVGEEVGWRGYLTPALKERFGAKSALIISGVIWGIWHAPLIILAGYEYGFGYFGAPITGVLLFCLITTSIGIILSRLYEKSNCIWIPALMHGAFNAISTIPMCFTNGSAKSYPLGPAPTGLIAGIPLMIVGAVLWIAKKENNAERH